jgi:hypothetical protein
LHAYALIRDPEGHVHELVHGDIVGRVWSAALQLDDGRVSEAHAMLSLREGQLQLIALRGRLAVEGQPQANVAIRPGLRVQLARGVELEVLEVSLPDHVLGVEGPTLPRQALPGVCSVLADPHVRLSAGWQEGARLHIWTTGERWMARKPGEAAAPLQAGEVVLVGGEPLRLVEIPLHDAGHSATRRQGELDAPVHIVAAFDTVHIHREGGVPVTLGGLQARLVSELVAIDGPVSWSVLAEELWPDGDDAFLRRNRLDTLLSRLRRRFRAAGLRADLVRADGSGTVELFLYPHDRVEDRT